MKNQTCLRERPGEHEGCVDIYEGLGCSRPKMAGHIFLVQLPPVLFLGVYSYQLIWPQIDMVILWKGKNMYLKGYYTHLT